MTVRTRHGIHLTTNRQDRSEKSSVAHNDLNFGKSVDNDLSALWYTGDYWKIMEVHIINYIIFIIIKCVNK